MWLSSLEQDLVWYVWSDNAPLGRPRTGPSWSWVYGSDGSIDWLNPCADEYYQLVEVVDRRNQNGEMAASLLLLTGTLLAVSVRTWTQRSEFEQAFPSTRHCRAIELKDRHHSSPLPDTAHPGLHFPPLPGSHYDSDDVDNYGNSSRQFPGHFNADYKFWSSEEDLQIELQNVVFFALGVENNGTALSNEDESEQCWVAGMVLKPIKDGDGDAKTEGVERFERVGWLRYCTEKARKDFVPAGTKTRFLLA